MGKQRSEDDGLDTGYRERSSRAEDQAGGRLLRDLRASAAHDMTHLLEGGDARHGTPETLAQQNQQAQALPEWPALFHNFVDNLVARSADHRREMRGRSRLRRASFSRRRMGSRARSLVLVRDGAGAMRHQTRSLLCATSLTLSARRMSRRLRRSRLRTLTRER